MMTLKWEFLIRKKFSVNTPKTQEQIIIVAFESYYKGCGYILPYFWMPRYVDAKDSSARTLKVYSEKQTA